MNPIEKSTCTAFSETQRIARGTFLEVALATKRYTDHQPNAQILVFDDVTSASVEFDLRGSEDDIAHRYRTKPAPVAPKQGPGRPKLGVVSREVTLLPRHWEWLSAQAGGASTVLRQLVEEARKNRNSTDRQRAAQEAAYKFMTAVAGNLPHYEEALRHLFAGQYEALRTAVQPWPKDVQEHIGMLLE